jgi:formate dehydrogenase subunit delta
MRIERLIAMANDIGDYFAAKGDPEAAAVGVAEHLKKFWDPRMRRQIIAHVHETGGEGLNPPVADAVRRLADARESTG